MIFIFVLFLGLATMSLSGIVDDLNEIIDRRIDRKHTIQVEEAARLTNLHLSMFNRYPNSEVELINFAKSIGERLNADTLKYVYVPEVIGSLYRYERVIIYVQNPKEIVLDSEFQLLNECGTGLNDDDGYCAPLGAKYTVLDANGHYQNVLRTINFRMNEAFYKIAQAYDGRTVGFPRRKADGVNMPDNTAVNLADFVGFIGLPSTCTGSFRFGRMFINCSDMFDEFGNPIIYYYKNSKEIYLIARTGIKDASGNFITVSRSAKV